MSSTINDSESCLFLSYSGEHREHAEFLKGEIEDACGTAVFAFTDPSSIAPGEHWYDKVIANLRRTKATLLLLSPSSVSRPWLLFESGAAIAMHDKLVALRFAGLPHELLPGALKAFQSCDLTERDVLVEMLSQLPGGPSVRKAGLAKAARTIVSYFRDIKEDVVESGLTERPLLSLNSRLALLAKLSDTERRLFFHVRTWEYEGKKKIGVLESAIREGLQVPSDHHLRKVWPPPNDPSGRPREMRGGVISPSEYYYRLRELYHLGLLEMEKVSEFENRWYLNDEIRQQLR